MAARGHVGLSRVPISFSKRRDRMRTLQGSQIHVAHLNATPFSPLSTNSWYYFLPHSIDDNQRTKTCDAYQYRSTRQPVSAT